MRSHLAAMRSAPMFEQVNALPDAEHETSGTHGYRKLGLSQHGADVRRHVIRSFLDMAIFRVVFRHKPGQKSLQIVLHIGVGIFLHDQAGRGMPHEQGQQRIAQAACGNPPGNVAGEIVQALPARRYFESMVKLSHAGILTRRIIALMKSLQLYISLPASHDQVLDCARHAAPGLLKLLRRGLQESASPGLTETLCRACGIPRQQDWPLAPICAAADGIPNVEAGYWLRLDPVHLEVVMGGLLLHPPAILDISPAEAEALVMDINLHWRDLPMRLIAASPTRWYLRLESTPDLLTIPLDQMHGEYLTENLPRGADARLFLQRINELQMLLHTHTINRQREDAGQPAINGLWLWGGGETSSGDPQTDLLLADEFEARALAGHVACSTGARPEALSAIRHDGRVLVILPQSGKHRDDDLASLLAHLEQHWFHPLLRQLARGGIRHARLELAGQTAVTLTPGRIWRFWR